MHIDARTAIPSDVPMRSNEAFQLYTSKLEWFASNVCGVAKSFTVGINLVDMVQKFQAILTPFIICGNAPTVHVARQLAPQLHEAVLIKLWADIVRFCIL